MSELVPVLMAIHLDGCRKNCKLRRLSTVDSRIGVQEEPIMRSVPPAVVAWASRFTILFALCVAPPSYAQTEAKPQQPATSSESIATASDLRPSSFQEITPGESKWADVQQKLGEPKADESLNGQRILTYEVGPFPRVEIVVEADTVISIVIHLDQSLPPENVVKQLSLHEFHSMVIYGDDGEGIGQAYPERGVLLSFAPGTAQVAQIILEPISVDAIWMRFDARDADDFEGRLIDVSLLLELEADVIEAYRQRSLLLSRTGDQREAVAAVESGLALAPNDILLLLASAELLANDGTVSAATAVLDEILKSEPTPLERAQALLLLGKVTAAGKNRNYEQAMQHQLAAIKLAAPLATSKVTAERREAIRTLVDGYLSVANNVARGPWGKKSEVTPKWLRSAEEMALKAIKDGDASEALRLRVWRSTLETYQSLDAYEDALPVFEAIKSKGQRLLNGSSDPHYQKLVRRELVRATFAVVRLQQAREQHAQALKNANEAMALAEHSGSFEDGSVLDQYLLGRLNFYVGAIYAVHHQDHTEAVRWFERALPYLPEELPESEYHDLGIHAERFVSMGVSYWEDDVQNVGIKLTQQGLSMLQTAARSKLVPETSLTIPYGNLAAMLRKAGRDEEARDYAARAARLESSSDNEQRSR